MNKQAIEDSISHWKRMIKWVSKYENKEAFPNQAEMELHLGETWNGEYCPLCIAYSLSCHSCPLTEIGKSCDDDRSPWQKVDRSLTWNTWLKHAKIMLKTLKSLMKK